MKYKNLGHKRKKNTKALEVSCGHCKTPILIYEKAGNGNLIKIQEARIIESEFDLKNHKGHLICINCKEELACRGTYNGALAYFVIRGQVNNKRLDSYR